MAEGINFQRKQYKLLNERSDINENNLIKRMGKNYSSTIKDIEEQIKELYEKYAERDPVTGILVLPKGKQNVLRRLEALKANVNAELAAVYAKNEDLLKKYTIGIYEDNYYTMGYVGEQAFDVNLTFDFVNRRNIITSLNTNPANGIKLNDILSKNLGVTKRKINGAINRTITQNRTLGQLSKDLRQILFDQRGNEVHGDAARAFRIARTETGRIKNAARMDAMNNISDQLQDQDELKLKKEWLSTLDDRTRPDHVRADGQNIDQKGVVRNDSGSIIARDGLFHVGGHTAPAPQQFGVAAQDINCRCTTIMTFFDERPTARRVDKKLVESKDAAAWKKAKIKELDEVDDPITTEKTTDQLLKQ